MLPIRPVLLPAAVAAVALAGCSLVDDGPRTSQTRHVGAFTRIDNGGAADLRVHVGERRRVRVHAGRHVIDDVRTEVRDGTLRVTFDHHGLGPGDVDVDISVPRLTEIASSGSGDVDADGIAAGAFALRSDGSGDVALQGTARRLTVTLDGSGHADLADLAAREAHVRVGGSGDAEVRAEQRLDATVDGSGGIRYHGHPALTRSVDGSGDVERAG